MIILVNKNAIRTFLMIFVSAIIVKSENLNSKFLYCGAIQCVLGKPQKVPFFSGPATKREVGWAGLATKKKLFF